MQRTVADEQSAKADFPDLSAAGFNRRMDQPADESTGG
jgi:hypothetical protein